MMNIFGYSIDNHLFSPILIYQYQNGKLSGIEDYTKEIVDNMRSMILSLHLSGIICGCFSKDSILRNENGDFVFPCDGIGKCT